MHNSPMPDAENLLRVGALPRIKEAIDGLHEAIKRVPNTGLRQAMLGHLHTLATEMLHQQSNLNAHKRVIRDAIEVMKAMQGPQLFTPEGQPVRDAIIGAWVQDVQDCMDGTTTDHYGRQMKAENTREQMPRVVQGMTGYPVPHARSS